MGIHDEKINDLMRFEGHVPPEYIKEKYIDELSHKDVVWVTLCQLLDHVRYNASERIFREASDAFSWSRVWVEQNSDLLPIRSRDPGGACDTIAQ